MPRSIGLEGGAGMSYMLSPRTEVGVTLAGNRISNRYQNGYSTNAYASIGRKMGLHWFLSAHGGGSTSELSNQLYGTPRTKNVIGGGTIGFRTFQHTLIGTYDRTSSDVYGLAVGTTTTLSAGWNWRRPGSRWSVFTSFGKQQSRDTGYMSLSGWEASGGVAQSLTSQARLSAQYVYLSNSGNYLGNTTNLAVQSIRVSLSWAPQAFTH
jgi:hypothetical protein